MTFTMTFKRRLILLHVISCLLWSAAQGQARPRHRIFNVRDRFFLEDLATSQIRPFDMWVTRMANALFDSRFTDSTIANLDDYHRYGVNTLVVGLQGGNLQTNKNHLYPRVYNASGTLDLNSVVWGNLGRLLAETDRRGMVLMIQYWYFIRDENVPDDLRALDITRAATRWLKSTGYRNYVLDVVNEFDNNAYEIPGKKGVKRPLFSILDGALRILQAVYSEDPDVMAGVSPPGGLSSPEGWLASPFGLARVESRIILGHNQVSDPNNPASYKVGTRPIDPGSRPHVNNEFDLQLGSERYPQIDPRSREYSYGHFTVSAVTRYLKDLKALRSMGAYGNVFSSRQQFIPPTGPIPDADVGPEGTQPEATAGAGEGSMHWLFSAIAAMKNLGSLETRHDMENGLASGIELDLAGNWGVNSSQIHQSDALIDPAWARMVTDSGDVDIAFEAAFLKTPGKDGRLGLHLGGPTPADPAYRLLVGRDLVQLDQVGGSLPVQSTLLPKNAVDLYRLRIQDGRLQVYVGGRKLFDAADVTPVQGRNLLLVTRKAAAAFDNLRTGPVRSVTFDSGLPGAWTAVDPGAWKVVFRKGSSMDRVFEAEVPIKEARHAVWNRVLDDFAFAMEVDLTLTTHSGFRFRLPDVQNMWAEGYTLWVTRGGDVTLERVPRKGSPIPLGSGKAAVNPASVRIHVSVEGNRIRVRVDSQKILDVHDPGAPLAGGALSLLAMAGKTRFDNLVIEGGPSLVPTPGFRPGTGSPLPAGFAVDFTDPDGGQDVTVLALHIDLGGGYVDMTPLLFPTTGLFTLVPTPDGKGARFLLKAPIPIGALKLKLKAVAWDHAGNEGQAVVGFNTP